MGDQIPHRAFGATHIPAGRVLEIECPGKLPVYDQRPDVNTKRKGNHKIMKPKRLWKSAGVREIDGESVPSSSEWPSGFQVSKHTRNTESGMYEQPQKAAYRCSVWAWRSWATLGIGFADHYRTKIDDSKKSLFCMLIGGGEVMIRLSGKGRAHNAKGPPRGTNV
ncbi:conserved hypothetical protein [Coccidioides posadasii str. Silveira]|uniref:Uncharacterized protein n=1 Tax=Coccidioides posadasii (strain RMSCC 757 / Silveira) TaxID=443226 RepID=E9CZU6_COCPS|nr:conserved hypothetical protein [Coccidioides posadasii str. Silveira]